MLGLSIADVIVLVLYFGVIVYIGIRASLKIKDKEDYFLGGRKFGKLTSTFASFGQATSADGPTGVATTTFNNGASGIWSSLLMLFATPVFWITSPWLRRLRILTMGDFYTERYGSKKMAATYALVATIGMMGLLSVGYIAVTKTTMAITAKADNELTVTEREEKQLAKELFTLESRDFASLSTGDKERLSELRTLNPNSLFSHVNENVIIWSICLIVLVYTALGGLEAAFYTDMLQGIFIIILSFIMIPFAWASINNVFGGSGALQALNHLHNQLPENFFEVFGSPVTIDFTWYYIIAAAVVSSVTVVTQPNQLVTAGAAKDEISARVGFVTGTFMKRVVTIMWGVLGLSAILLYKDTITDSDLVWGFATKELLGSMGIGLVGLMLASMMAALMSTADCLMITVSGLIVNNLYRPLANIDSERHYIWVGRIAGGVYLVGAALITTQFDGILQVLKFIWEFFVIFAAAFWLGLKWRRANVYGAWASIVGTFSIFYLIPLLLPILFTQLRTNDYLLKQTNIPPIERVYTAKVMDVEQRANQIIEWENASEIAKQSMTKPAAIAVGEKITKQFAVPQRSIFWSKGIKKDDSGNAFGSGYLYLEMIVLDKLGFNLASNPYALNETVRLLIRLSFPFSILMLISLLTQRDDAKLLNRFYRKMRTRVGINGAKEEAKSIGLETADDKAGENTLIFKDSDWEFYKWNKEDSLGFAVSWLVVLFILGLLYLVVSVGS
ncbi:sodium:solute symporter family protein [Chondrinema litorale]|uniref:sodium:solute symporter family protein n=1 Tax=Chondrinema litorale TaxID=2994555 RepID=UPI002543E249|nr:sodium:solute symporter family protein [Chondrinema litorale]UZR99150.1 sodium:solute symporter family protein [Chondrinema litorale]